MNLKLPVLLCFVFLFLIACSTQKTYHFKGESENWHVDNTIDIIDNDSEFERIKIKYIGDNEIPEEIYYEIKGNSGNTLLNDGVFKTSDSACYGCALTKENEEIDVTIEWNGKSDSFTLKNK